MADANDSKSFARKGMRVRVSPRALMEDQQQEPTYVRVAKICAIYIFPALIIALTTILFLVR